MSQITVNGVDSLVKIGRRCRFRNLTIDVVGCNSTVEIQENVSVYEKCSISIKGDNCHCIIGAKTTIGSASLFLEESGTDIIIGNDCMLGRDVVIHTTGFHSIVDSSTGKRINYPESVFVGNHVWLATGVITMKGASVSDNSVAGERAMITKKFT